MLTSTISSENLFHTFNSFIVVVCFYLFLLLSVNLISRYFFPSRLPNGFHFFFRHNWRWVKLSAIMKKEKVFISILLCVLICSSVSEGKDCVYFCFARAQLVQLSRLFFHRGPYKLCDRLLIHFKFTTMYGIINRLAISWNTAMNIP